MPEKTVQTLETIPAANPPREEVDDSRVLPLAVAGLICFTIAVVLGYGGWYFFGSHNRRHAEPDTVVTTPVAEPVASPSAPTPETSAATPNGNYAPEKPAEPKPEGVIRIEGGEVALGGGKSGVPLKRIVVENFSIAETEVTNAQYAEFVKETGHQPPVGWTKEVFPTGTENYPVTNVSFRDASDFCEWLGKKLNATVRLPNEAEWERAARGREGNKYPWGNEWNKDAAVSKETGGKISAVKSFPLNRSNFGAFDMAGNVWEWTADKVENDGSVTDEQVKAELAKGRVLRIIKGGTAKDPAAQISAQARFYIPESIKAPEVGFRYVIIR